MKGTLLVIALLLLAVLLGLSIGQVMIGPAALWDGLWHGSGPGALFLRVLRGPGVGTALGAGAVLGMSGAIFQILLRNPLASPDVMGFTSGAGLAAIWGVSAGIALPIPLFSAIGGLAAAGAVIFLASGRSGTHAALTLILVGLGVGFFAAAASSFIMTRLPHQEATEAQRWLTGSLAARNWGHVLQVFGLGAALTLALALQTRSLALLELGDDLAAGLGTRISLSRGLLAVTGVLLAATGVAVAGPLPFIALMAAPLGARLTGARHPAGKLASAAAAGAIITVLADLASRAAIPGLQLPVGVMTGILGAPYLIWLLLREMETGDL